MKYENETKSQNAVLIKIYIAQHVYNMRFFFRNFCLIHGKELKSCRDGQLFNHTVPAKQA